jgi:hypothetical protein
VVLFVQRTHGSIDGREKYFYLSYYVSTHILLSTSPKPDISHHPSCHYSAIQLVNNVVVIFEWVDGFASFSFLKLLVLLKV